MSDRCSLELTIKNSDVPKFIEAFNVAMAYDQMDELSDWGEVEEGEKVTNLFIEEANNGVISELTYVAEVYPGGVPFSGSHSAGGDYDPGVFVSFSGLIIWLDSYMRDLSPVIPIHQNLKIDYDDIAYIALYYELLAEFHAYCKIKE